MRLLVILLLLLLPNFAFSTGLIEKEALNGHISLLLPSSFSRMSQERLELKYPSSYRPTEVYTDQTGGINVALNHTMDVLDESQIEEIRLAFSQMFHDRYPGAEWFRDETTEINGKKFAIFELITPAVDTQIHNIMVATSVENRLLLISFNTTVEQSGKWLSIGNKIVSSVKTRD